MNDIDKPGTPSLFQPFDFRRSGYALIAGIVGIADGLCWGMYWETNRIVSSNPLGTVSLSYHLGLLAYSLLALVLTLLAGAVLHRFIKQGSWSEMERCLFYCIALLGIVMLMTGFEFLFWLDWQYRNPIFYLLVKAAFSGLFVVFLVRIARIVLHD